MARDCERCDGHGEIHNGDVTLDCPNCREVCQWCNSAYDDGEELGDTGLVVCRPCIRDMGFYKERDGYQLFAAAELDQLIENPDALRDDLSAAVDEVFRGYGVDIEQSGWGLRNAAAAEGSE